jgi:ketol-acid reductoisomerase
MTWGQTNNYGPGSLVRGVIRKLEGAPILVAVDVNYDGGANELTV